jgi:starch synthase (maltosyl-transferring)
MFSSGVMMPIGYEFGFRKKLHVVETRARDWEETDIDITDYIKKVNQIKETYKIFQEESPIEIINTNNHNILVMWQGSTKTKEEALVILNKDSWNSQHFHEDNLKNYVQAGAPLIDVSPEYPVDFVPQPFVYDLNPGQGLILVTQRDDS